MRAAVGSASVKDLVVFSKEVRAALAHGRPVVALETTLVAHGFPAPEGIEVGLESERRVREAGAVPATVGVLDGHIRIGLEESELARFTPEARKCGARDLAAAAVQGAVGATTVGGTLAAAHAGGIRFLGTGGLGGVHRGWPTPPDVSSDLAVLARTEALIVSSGVKSLLDVPATVELLETLGVPVLGWRTDTLPLFYSAHGGPPVSGRVESAAEAGRIASEHWALGGGGLLVGRPPDESLEVEELIEEAVAEARERGIVGGAVTPFVLSRLHERSDGRTLAVNRELIAANAGLAAEIAVAHGNGG
jgi:pseudouridylate synthase